MKRARGFTLIEVLIAVLMLTAATMTFAVVAATIRDRDRETAAYAQDLAGLRRAVRAVQADLREARADDKLAYRLEGHTLLRRGQVLARNIASFYVQRDDALAQVWITLAPRSDAPTRREASLQFAVHMRNRDQGGGR